MGCKRARVQGPVMLGGATWMPAPSSAARGAHQRQRARRIAVDAHGIEIDGDVLAVDGADLAVDAGAQHLGGDLVRVQRLWAAGEDDGAAGVVVAIGIELAHHGLAQFARDAAGHRVFHAVQGQRRLQFTQRLDQPARQRLVARGQHVQRAMRFHVLQPQPCRRANSRNAPADRRCRGPGRRRFRADRGGRSRPGRETGMGADADAMLARQQHGAVHDVGIAGMKAGGDVGRADQRHDGVVHAVSDGPWAESFAHVGIQVDAPLAHCGMSPSCCGPRVARRLT